MSYKTSESAWDAGKPYGWRSGKKPLKNFFKKVEKVLDKIWKM